MSVQSDVHQFLASVAKGANGDFIAMDPGKVAEQVGTTRNKVNKTLFNLSVSKKIELQRGPNGRQIVGYKVLAEPSAPRTRAVRKVGRQRLSQPAVIYPNQPGAPRRRSIHTPHLDEYAASKEKFERLTTELGELVTAEFRENAYAEEGLMLRERLAGIEGSYGELMAANEAMTRDLRALRGRVNRELAESVEANGQSVKGGD